MQLTESSIDAYKFTRMNAKLNDLLLHYLCVRFMSSSILQTKLNRLERNRMENKFVH